MTPLEALITPGAQRAVNKAMHNLDMDVFHKRLLDKRCPFCPAGSPTLGELRKDLLEKFGQSDPG